MTGLQVGQDGLRLDQSPLRKGDGIFQPRSNDQMIEHTDIDKLQRIFQPLRYALIGLTGTGIATWMVMSEDHRRCV